MSAHLPAEVMAALAVILLAARASGALARRLGQPAVIGEITAGLALGPSLLGLVPGDLPHLLFPADTRPVLGAIAQLGLVLFMFLIGLEADTSLVRGQARLAFTVSLSSIALPFALGVPLALVLHPAHDSGAAGNTVAFVLFIGASLSVTAFPVLARILTERRMDRTPLGTLALATASLDDVIAWSLLAVVVAIVVSGGPLGAVGVALGAVAFTAALALVGRPLMKRVFRAGGAGLSPGTFALVLAGVLIAACATDRIGVHLVFGAFAFGVLFPNDPALREAVAQRVEAVTVLLLPVFFVVTGLGVDLSRLTAGNLGELALILAVAVGGKVGGAFVAARLHGLDGRRSLALGLLANTRGLTELVILGIGRQLGVLDAELFGLLVVMALVTTAMAGPALDLVYPRRLVETDLALAERAAAGAMTVVTSLPPSAHDSEGDAPTWGSLLTVSAGLARSAAQGHVLLSRVLPLPGDLGVGALGLLAAEVDAVARAGRTIAGPSVTATPNVVRAHDPVDEIRHQVRRVEADWLVTGTRPTVTTDADADVVLVGAGAAPPHGAVLLTSGEPAAWEVAARLALGLGTQLEIRARGARQLADAARRLGIEVLPTAGDAEDRPSPAIVVGGPQAGPDLPLVPGTPARVAVMVLPAGPRARHGLGERAARIPARDRTPQRILIEEPI